MKRCSCCGCQNDYKFAARRCRSSRVACAPHRTHELPGANPLKDPHAALDAAILAAQGFSAKKDLLAHLLQLNRAVPNASKELILRERHILYFIIQMEVGCLRVIVY